MPLPGEAADVIRVASGRVDPGEMDLAQACRALMERSISMDDF